MNRDRIEKLKELCEEIRNNPNAKKYILDSVYIPYYERRPTDMDRMKMLDGQRMIMCPGCRVNHLLDDRWKFNNNFEKPTFEGSLLVKFKWGIERKEFLCHSYIKDGNIQFLNDTNHELSGQTVELPTIDKWDSMERE
jgi:hypothetical protein